MGLEGLLLQGGTGDSGLVTRPSICPQVLPSKSWSSSPKEMVLFFTWYARGSLGPASRSEHRPPPLLTFKPSTGPDDFVFKHDPNLLPSSILITTTLVQACWRPHSSILRASLTPTCNPTPILRVRACVSTCTRTHTHVCTQQLRVIFLNCKLRSCHLHAKTFQCFCDALRKISTLHLSSRPTVNHCPA